MEQLKPCPFCGCKAHIGVYYDFYRIGCSTSTCQAHLPEIFNSGSTDNNWYGSIPEAIEAWNTRYQPTCTMIPVTLYDEECIDGIECSECGWTEIHDFFDPLPNTCPKCGRKVVEE